MAGVQVCSAGPARATSSWAQTPHDQEKVQDIECAAKFATMFIPQPAFQSHPYNHAQQFERRAS
eukprot:2481586-Pyramimonas_sp.AAC.1